MTKNPIINALLAALYIVVLVLTITFVAPKGPDIEIIMPIVMLSLFVLSAAVMGYIFLYQPIQMFLDGKRKEGVDLFLKTVGSFAVVVVVFLCVLFFANTNSTL